MKLYFAPGACSLAPHIVIREAGLEAELVAVDLRAHRVGDRDYRQVNPKGSVPALELDGGEVLTENAVVLQYLAALAPQARLGPPPEGLAHWRFLELISFIATELHKGFGPLFKGAQGEAREAAVANLGQKFDLLAAQLADRSYLTGERFTIADAYAYVTLNWTRLHQIDLGKWPSLRALMERIEARPAVQQARHEEGLDQPSPTQGAAARATAQESRPVR